MSCSKKPNWTRFFLALILVFSLVTRVYRLGYPDEYMFDEVYHAFTAKLMAASDPRAFEWWHHQIEPDTAVDWLHPPLAKYFQALSINLLGNNSFSWRISSAIFGVGVIWLTFLLARDLFEDDNLALLASGLTTLDGLLLAQSRITMNDIHVTFFILLSLWCYQRYRQEKSIALLWITGISLGSAIATKWSGLLMLAAVGWFELMRIIKLFVSRKKSTWLSLLAAGKKFFILAALPLLIYIGAYTPMFLQGKAWSHFTALHQQIWSYQTQLVATHSYQSRPWQWFFNLRPVWFHVEYVESGLVANIYASGNPFLFWLGAVAVVWTGIALVRRALVKKITPTEKTLGWLWLAYLFVWLPWQFSPRIMFFYHYAPAVPLMSIILAYWLLVLWRLHAHANNIEWNQMLFWLCLMLIGGSFLVWYPHWTGLPMSKDFISSVYFALPSWQ